MGCRVAEEEEKEEFLKENKCKMVVPDYSAENLGTPL